jgi:hypothetical protein
MILDQGGLSVKVVVVLSLEEFFQDFEKAGQRSLILPFGGNKHGFCVGWVDPKQDKTS